METFNLYKKYIISFVLGAILSFILIQLFIRNKQSTTVTKLNELEKREIILKYENDYLKVQLDSLYKTIDLKQIDTVFLEYKKKKNNYNNQKEKTKNETTNYINADDSIKSIKFKELLNSLK
jgi:hypothetical protein